MLRELSVCIAVYCAGHKAKADRNNKNKIRICYQSNKFPEEDVHGDKVTGEAPKAAYSDEDLEKLVDSLLQETDKDGDGYVTYSEYRINSS